MNKGEAIRRLKRKMKGICKRCELTNQVLFYRSVTFKECDDCPFAWFINLMIKEFNEQ